MEHATIIGIDLAKRSFQLHGAREDGSVAFREKLSRERVLDFVASHPPCVVAMEACASAHHWGREFGKLGHEVKLVPPIYVKPFEHTPTILDSTRVSPYRPAAVDVPQSMRPDTRQHLTACTEPSEEMSSPDTGVNRFGGAQTPSLRSEVVYLAHGRPRLSSRCAAPPRVPSMTDSLEVRVLYPARWRRRVSEAQGRRREAGSEGSAEQSRQPRG